MSASTACSIFLLMVVSVLFLLKMYAEREDAISRVGNLAFAMGAFTTAGYLFFAEASWNAIVSFGAIVLFVSACWALDHFLVKPRLCQSDQCPCGK